MRYLELDDLLAIACEVLELEAAALVHVTDLGLADSAVSRPHASYGGEEFYPTIEQKAATLLFGIARNHAFVDGNKRVAVLATLQFLNQNGRDLDLTPPEKAYEIIAGTAAGTVTLEELTSWVTDQMRDLDDG